MRRGHLILNRMFALLQLSLELMNPKLNRISLQRTIRSSHVVQQCACKLCVGISDSLQIRVCLTVVHCP